MVGVSPAKASFGAGSVADPASQLSLYPALRSSSQAPSPWALVSNLGFLKFQISIFSILEIIFLGKIFLKIMLVRYRGINNKGVLERPWTKWRVLKAISSTWKFQVAVKC